MTFDKWLDDHAKTLRYGDCFTMYEFAEAAWNAREAEIAELKAKLATAEHARNEWEKNWAEAKAQPRCDRARCYTLHDACLERDALREECEKLRMQLAGCGVAAMTNTASTAAARITKDNPYWSASYGDVCAAVDREMALREENEKLREFLRQRDKTAADDEAEIARLREQLVKAREGLKKIAAPLKSLDVVNTSERWVEIHWRQICEFQRIASEALDAKPAKSDTVTLPKEGV